MANNHQSPYSIRELGFLYSLVLRSFFPLFICLVFFFVLSFFVPDSLEDLDLIVNEIDLNENSFLFCSYPLIPFPSLALRDFFF